VVRLGFFALAFAALVAREPVVNLRLEAPFDELFQTSKTTPDYAVDGMLTDGTGTTGPVKISVRGHTSRREAECVFPKLKVQRADGTTLKLGTHCGEAKDDKLSPKYGRLANEKSPWREVAIYQILDVLGVPTLHAKAARVTYVYPDGREIERNALIVEDDDDAAKRMGGTKTVAAEAFTTADQMLEPADAATLAFAQALVGNFDWCVKFSPNDTYRCDARMKLWNVIGVQMPGGKVRPVMHDFDVSGMVAGSHSWFKNVFNAGFIESGSEREIEVLGQVQRTRTLFPRAELDAARKRFAAKRADAYRALDEATVDADGRAIIKDYLDAFFRAIETDQQFYRPVVVARDTIARSAPGPSAPAVCPALGAIPVGTPVTEPRETQGDSVKVVVLDALWHWATPRHCAPIKTGPVWIPAASISRDFPER
jgi:hypothetical protein